MKGKNYYYGQQDVEFLKIKNQKILSFLKEIIMVTYDPQRTDKKMNLYLTHH